MQFNLRWLLGTVTGCAILAGLARVSVAGTLLLVTNGCGAAVAWYAGFMVWKETAPLPLSRFDRFCCRLGALASLACGCLFCYLALAAIFHLSR
jgi:hypothetical protein